MTAPASSRRLTSASTEIDSYIESRFALPFTDPPAILNQVSSDIAWYRLQVARPLRDSKDAKERYDSRIAWLKQVRDGDITLGLALTQKEPTIATPTRDHPEPHDDAELFTGSFIHQSVQPAEAEFFLMDFSAQPRDIRGRWTHGGPLLGIVFDDRSMRAGLARPLHRGVQPPRQVEGGEHPAALRFGQRLSARVGSPISTTRRIPSG